MGAKVMNASRAAAHPIVRPRTGQSSGLRNSTLGRTVQVRRQVLVKVQVQVWVPWQLDVRAYAALAWAIMRVDFRCFSSADPIGDLSLIGTFGGDATVWQTEDGQMR